MINYWGNYEWVMKSLMNSKLVILVSSYDEILLSGIVHLFWRCLCEIYGYMYEYVYSEYGLGSIACELKL